MQLRFLPPTPTHSRGDLVPIRDDVFYAGGLFIIRKATKCSRVLLPCSSAVALWDFSSSTPDHGPYM
jgi:hypothetical protein